MIAEACVPEQIRQTPLLLLPRLDGNLDVVMESNRRQADRFPMDRDVHYKILNRQCAGEVGIGKTINMSSNGVLFTTDGHELRGRTLEVSISWPAQLNSVVPLKLVTRGRVVRSGHGIAAIEIQHRQFRTQGSVLR